MCALPPLCSFQRMVFTTAAKMFSSTYKVMVEGEGDAVGYLNPLLAMAAVINVSLPGHQPDLKSASEDMRLFNKALVDKSGRCPCFCPSQMPCLVVRNFCLVIQGSRCTSVRFGRSSSSLGLLCMYGSRSMLPNAACHPALH
jgi:hypothetical protein